MVWAGAWCAGCTLRWVQYISEGSFLCSTRPLVQRHDCVQTVLRVSPTVGKFSEIIPIAAQASRLRNSLSASLVT